MEDAKGLYELIKVVGTPGLVAIMLLWFARWIKPIIERLVERHLEFVDRIEKSQDALCDTTAATDRKMEVVMNATTKTALQLDQVGHKLDEMNVNMGSVCGYKVEKR